jgi:hypothetical protein
MTITKFTIYGERCSGTNYLEELILENFDVTLTSEYGWKHFFGFQDDKLKNSDDTLFICIVRDIYEWMNSFFKQPHHLPIRYKNIDLQTKKYEFLNNEFWSFDDSNGNRDTNKEIMTDRNIYTNCRYQNIFELRHTKLKYMITDLPNKVKNYILIRYEDLINDFVGKMITIKNKGLKKKHKDSFPKNTDRYKKNENIKFYKNKNKEYFISKNEILQNPNLIPFYEKKLGYIKVTYS